MRNLPERRSKFSSIYTKALDILKHEGHEEARDCRACSLISLSLCPSSTALRSSTILSRALTPSRSFVLSLCPSSLSLSLSECSGTHTLARSRFSRTYTRGIWRGGYTGIVEHEYQEHSPRPSRPALFYVACDSSIPVHSYAAGLPRIDRKTETNRERNGWVDRSSMNTFRSSNAYVICCSCLRDV